MNWILKLTLLRIAIRPRGQSGRVIAYGAYSCQIETGSIVTLTVRLT